MEIFMIIDVSVHGIPCQAAMVGGHYVKPDSGADNPCDYAGGWFDFEFELLDRKGYRAKWLEKKMSDADAEKIMAALIKELEGGE
jgi:hypothetical protein